MYLKFKVIYTRIVGVLFVIFLMYYGIFTVYENAKNTSSLKSISGTIIYKGIKEVKSTRSKSFYMEYQLDGQLESIGYEVDDIGYRDKLQIGKEYKFYFISSIYTGDIDRMGVRRIDYLGKPVFLFNSTTIIGLGVFSIIASIVLALILIYDFNKTNKLI